MKLYDGDIFEHDGYTFRVNYEPDIYAGFPWEEEDGHGIVRKANNAHYDGRSDKAPGERPLNRAGYNEYQFYYDWAATMKKAKVEGWGLCDENKAALAVKLGRVPTRGDIVAESVRRNFEYCRHILNDDCPYVGVVVTRVEADEDGDYVDFESDSVWRVETSNDWHMDQAREMASDMARDARKEESERAYWAARDVATV